METKRMDVRREMELGYKQQVAFFVYYNSNAMPTSFKKKEQFFNRLGRMKEALDVKHVFEANDSSAIENVISPFGIDPEQSIFISDGKIQLDNMRRLKQDNADIS